jgi:beta-N-acetylhexosaminidase
MRGGVVSAALLSVALLGCSSTSPTASEPGSTPTVAGSPGASFAPSPGAESTSTPDCASTTLASMSEPQRVGQLFMVKLPDNAVTAAVRDAVANEHIGSVWFGRSSAGIAALRSVADGVQRLASQEATAGVGFLISANQEGGRVQGLSGPGFDTIPSAVVQGTWSTDRLEASADTWGSQLVDAGVNANFAPVADVVPAGTEGQNAPIGALQREYGNDPGTVSDHVAAFIAGMQEAGIATTAKHFPGLGRVEGNTDSTADVVDSVTTLDDPYLQPFATAIESDTPFVMVSLATYTQIDPDNIAAFSPAVMGDLLRGDLGFEGVILSDSLSATAVTDLRPGTRATRFLQAGGDLIVLTPLTTAIAMARAVLAHTGTDASLRARVDDAALRILEAKDEAGLLPCS